MEEEITAKKIGRPIGAKNKKPYPMTSAAYHQRCVAPLKHGNNSKIMNDIILKQELTPEQTEALAQERLAVWKKFDTPTLMLMSEYDKWNTLVNLKMMKHGEDLNSITGKDMRECIRLLLDISKELNRLKTVSADKKFEAFVKGFNDDEDVEYDMDTDVTIKEDSEVENGNTKEDTGTSEEVQQDRNPTPDIQDTTN